MQYLQAQHIAITAERYEQFITANPALATGAPDISVLTPMHLRQAVAWVASALRAEIGQILQALQDPGRGVISVDIAPDLERSLEADAYWGVALASALTANVFAPARDRCNDMPFTVHVAAPDKSQDLSRLGVSTLAPQTRLGFHTDGVIRGQQVALPRHIMLYNVMIGYEKPGCFYWVPFALWDDKQVFMRRLGVGKRYPFTLTPSVYQDEQGGLQVVTPEAVEVPVFLDNLVEDFPLYLNGEMKGPDPDPGPDPERSHDPLASFNPGASAEQQGDEPPATATNVPTAPTAPTATEEIEAFKACEVITALRQSLQDNPRRFAIAQRARRLIFACNTRGAHARDVFEGLQGQEAPYTRIFLRAVDVDCVAVDG